MNTISSQGIGAVSLISEGIAPIPCWEIVFTMITRPDKIVWAEGSWWAKEAGLREFVYEKGIRLKPFWQ